MTTMLLQVSATSLAQRVTFKQNDASLKEIFREVKKQTGYSVLSTAKTIEEAPKMDVNFLNTPLEDVLKTCLGEQYSYVIEKKTILIRKKEPVLNKAVRNIAFGDLKGRVNDEKGSPLPGATVTEKGTNNSVITNSNGEFEIKNISTNATLIVSFVGFVKQEVAAGNLDAITIILVEEKQSLNEVIVVGYGTQKKLNLTGAVDQVGKEVFEKRPSPNITRALQGEIPNLNIRMTDGKPTRSATYNVRGTGSIGAGGSALILIDGVSGDPNLLNPNDIESVSVLKDASSAAIYGARGAFGVVLITTKKPLADKIRVNYSGNYSINQRTVTPDLITDGYTWAKMFDESYYASKDYKSHPTSVNNAFPFSLTYLDELKKRHDDPSLPKTDIDPATGNYVYYGSTDWLKELYRDNIPSMEHSLSVSGGSKLVNYYISGRYYKQDGIYNYSPDDFNKYNFRAKGDIKITPWLTLSNNLDYSKQSYFYPLNSIYLNGIWRNIADQGIPMVPLFNPDGSLPQVSAFHVGDYAQGNSHQNENQKYFRNTVGLASDLLDHQLKINGDFTYSNQTSDLLQQLYPVTYSTKPNQFASQGTNQLSRTIGETNYYAANLYAAYTKTFGDHEFKALVGYNVEFNSFHQNQIRKDGLLDPTIPDFNVTDGLNYLTTGGGQEWGILGGFYRLNYAYKNRYLFEFNGRYDGSSKFPSNQRFGFFPSASMGWRVSEEGFMKSTKNWLTDLKFRASYGSLGNGQIDPYLYQQTLAIVRSGVLLNGVFPSTINNPAVLPDGLTWEKSTTLNLGLDASFLNGRLSTTFDWYNRKTTDMFTALQPLPRTFGATVPQGNNADLSTKGWELSIGWRDKVNTVGYNLRVVVSDAQSVITKFNNPTGSLGTYYVGQKIGEIWGYETEGLFTSYDDIKNHADQSYIRVSDGNILMPGDLKFRDLNGDGKINDGSNTLSEPGDRKIIGNTEPRYAYGVNMGIDWKGFSFSAFVQGIAKRDWWPGSEAGYFWGQYNRPYGFSPTAIIGNYWTEEDPNPNAYFPRLRGYASVNANRELIVNQTRYLQDASYIRLKTITLAYSLPKKLTNRLKLFDVRFYLTGQNLWTYSPMYKINKNFDPEVIENSDPEIKSTSGKGYAYPMLKTYTLGLNVTF